MEWLIGQSGIRLDPTYLLAAAAVGLVVGLVSVLARGFLIASLEEIGRIWREAGPGISAALLRRRRATLPSTQWFCARCLSHNGPVASRCYACGARRAESEAMAPDPEPKAVQRAGRTLRR